MNSRSSGSESSTELARGGTGAGIAENIEPTGGSSAVGQILLRGDSNSGGSNALSLMTLGNRPTGMAVSIGDPANRGRASSRKAPERRSIHKANALFLACLDDLQRALDESDDLFSRSNAIEHFRVSLDSLWGLRKDREEAYAEVINLLQSVFCKRTAEDFSRTQLEAVRNAVERLTNQEEIHDDIADSITMDLLDGGIDVFRELE